MDQVAGPIRVHAAMLDLAIRAAYPSKAAFARAADISEGHVSRIVNGQGGVSVEVMANILDAFGNRVRLRELAIIEAANPAGDRTSIDTNRTNVR